MIPSASFFLPVKSIRVFINYLFTVFVFVEDFTKDLTSLVVHSVEWTLSWLFNLIFSFTSGYYYITLPRRWAFPQSVIYYYYYYHYYYYPLEFFTSALTEGFSLEFEWEQVSSSLLDRSPGILSILAVLNKAVVWMFSTRPPTSLSSSPYSNPLVTVPNAPITYLPNPSARRELDTRSFFKRNLTGLNSKFPFS